MFVKKIFISNSSTFIVLQFIFLTNPIVHYFDQILYFTRLPPHDPPHSHSHKPHPLDPEIKGNLLKPALRPLHRPLSYCNICRAISKLYCHHLCFVLHAPSSSFLTFVTFIPVSPPRHFSEPSIS